MKYFRIEKFFRGGRTVYYAKMKNHQRVRHNCWGLQLEEWGENTDGGYNYGYRIYLKARLKKCPANVPSYRWLKFNPHYITEQKRS